MINNINVIKNENVDNKNYIRNVLKNNLVNNFNTKNSKSKVKYIKDFD